MKINYDRVAELLQSEEFKAKVKALYDLDQKDIRSGKKTYGAFFYIAAMICSDIPFKEITGPIFTIEETGDFVFKYINYIAEILGICLGIPSEMRDKIFKLTYEPPMKKED